MYLVMGGLFAALGIYHLRRFLLVKNEMEELFSKGQLDHALQGQPCVTFLVAGWNAAEDVAVFIEEFRSLPIVEKQLVLCMGGNDGSYELSRAFESDDVCVLEQAPGMGKQKALRKSLPYATGEWIYLTDIDSRLSPDCVTKMMDALGKGRAACVTGGMAPLSSQEDNGFVRAQWAIDRYGNLKTSEFTSGILGANTLLTRAALRDAGDFQQDAPSGTDYTLAKELLATGHAIVHVKGAEVRTEFSREISSYTKRRARWLRNVLVLGRRYRCYGEMRTVLLTITISFLYPVLLVAGFADAWVWGIFLLLFAHSSLSRIRYCKVTEVSSGLIDVWKTIVGDALGGILAGYEVLAGSARW